jgi:hypothetical protein
MLSTSASLGDFDSTGMNAFIVLADIWNFVAGLSATILVLVVIASLFWIWAIIDCATNPNLDSVQKIVWLLVIFFLHILGAIVYVAAGRGRTRRLQTS